MDHHVSSTNGSSCEQYKQVIMLAVQMDHHVRVKVRVFNRHPKLTFDECDIFIPCFHGGNTEAGIE